MQQLTPLQRQIIEFLEKEGAKDFYVPINWLSFRVTFFEYSPQIMMLEILKLRELGAIDVKADNQKMFVKIVEKKRKIIFCFQQLRISLHSQSDTD